MLIGSNIISWVGGGGGGGRVLNNALHREATTTDSTSLHFSIPFLLKRYPFHIREEVGLSSFSSVFQENSPILWEILVGGGGCPFEPILDCISSDVGISC